MVPQHGEPSLCCVTYSRQVASLSLLLGATHSEGLLGPARGTLGLALQLRGLHAPATRKPTPFHPCLSVLRDGGNQGRTCDLLVGAGGVQEWAARQ